MAPHLDALIGKLLVLLQRGKRLVQEGALTAIASAADSSEELFVKYYDAVMPLLSSILVNAQDKQVRFWCGWWCVLFCFVLVWCVCVEWFVVRDVMWCGVERRNETKSPGKRVMLTLTFAPFRGACGGLFYGLIA
jgi:hypothetical protein